MTNPRFIAGEIIVEKNAVCATYSIDDTSSEFSGYHAGRIVVYGSSGLRDLIIRLLNECTSPPVPIMRTSGIEMEDHADLQADALKGAT